MFKRIYLAICILCVGGYGLASLCGWELQRTEKQVLPQGIRQAPGGYRSFRFWHSGFQGGK